MILGIWGEEKTCKTTLALSASKVNPVLAHMELDIGGFKRADYRFQDEIKAGKIVTQWEFNRPGSSKKVLKRLRYPLPVDGIGALTGDMQQAKLKIGWKELWYQFYGDYLQLLASPEISTIVLDSGTIMWNVCTDAYLQEKQELQFKMIGGTMVMNKPGECIRTQLSEIEYREPNDRMLSFVQQAKNYEKNLIVCHHATDEYKNQMVKGEYVKAPTGKRVRHGWKGLGINADFILHTYTKLEPQPNDSNGKPVPPVEVPYASIDLAEILQLKGMELREPTFEMLMQLRSVYRGGY